MDTEERIELHTLEIYIVACRHKGENLTSALTFKIEIFESCVVRLFQAKCGSWVFLKFLLMYSLFIV